jgi:hypothetical protein
MRPYPVFRGKARERVSEKTSFRAFVNGGNPRPLALGAKSLLGMRRASVGGIIPALGVDPLGKKWEKGAASCGSVRGTEEEPGHSG